MSHPNKVKGTRWEGEVEFYLVGAGFPEVERRSLKGTKDQGDLVGVPGWVLECKNEKSIRLGAYMDEGAVELINAQEEAVERNRLAPIFFAAIVKRRRKNVREAYAVMPLSQLTQIMRRLNA